MTKSLEASYKFGVRVGKQHGSVGQVRLHFEQLEERFKDPEAREICEKSIADLMSGSDERLSDAHRRLYSHIYLVWETDRESTAFLAGLLKGWAESRGMKLSLAA